MLYSPNGQQPPVNQGHPCGCLSYTGSHLVKQFSVPTYEADRVSTELESRARMSACADCSMLLSPRYHRKDMCSGRKDHPLCEQK